MQDGLSFFFKFTENQDFIKKYFSDRTTQFFFLNEIKQDILCLCIQNYSQLA